MIRAVIFDLDGTLIDSAPDLHAAAVAMLRRLGRPEITLQQVTSFIGNGVPMLVERCLRAAGCEPDPAENAAALAIFREFYDAAPAVLTKPYPGVPAPLGRLAREGVRMGVCTNKPQEPAEAILARFGLRRQILAVVGGDALPVIKPDPAPLLLCFDRLGAGAARLYIGDSETDAATAAAAGVPFALFAGGYRKSPVDAMGATLVFDSFDELSRLVLDRHAG
jgi:phosphoglycolate phosphatase